MKLRTIDDEGEESYITVQFWSFFKCYFFCWLVFLGVAFCFGALMAIIGVY